MVIEPLVQGRRHVVRLRVRRAADRGGVPPGRHAPDLRRGGDRIRADGDAVRLRAVRPAPRSHVPREGDHGRVPGHVGHRGVGRGLRRLPRGRPRARDLLPRAFLRRERVGRGRGSRTPAADRVLGCPGQRAAAADQLYSLLGERVAGRAAVREIRQRASWSASSVPALARTALGSAGVRRCGLPGGAAAPVGRRGGADAAAHHRRRTRSCGSSTPSMGRSTTCEPARHAPPHERRPRGKTRIRAALDRVVDEGRWRSPREFDALGPAGVLEGRRWCPSRPTTISD